MKAKWLTYARLKKLATLREKQGKPRLCLVLDGMTWEIIGEGLNEKWVECCLAGNYYFRRDIPLWKIQEKGRVS